MVSSAYLAYCTVACPLKNSSLDGILSDGCSHFGPGRCRCCLEAHSFAFVSERSEIVTGARRTGSGQAVGAPFGFDARLCLQCHLASPRTSSS